MSLSDPIADALTRIRNAVAASHLLTYVSFNNVIFAMMKILKEEGFIENVIQVKNSSRPQLRIDLKYNKGESSIRGLKRISKPGRRVYVNAKNIGATLNNIGVGILTTPKGVLSDKEAKFQHVGGEYLCQIW